MLRARVSAHVGLLWWLLSLWGADGYIEIVEEQRCHHYHFRLTCRELQSHIAVLEAWYLTIDEYYQVSHTPKPPPTVMLSLKTERDAELDRVFVYSSPKRDGVYVSANYTNDNVTMNDNVTINDNVTNVNDSARNVNESEALDFTNDINDSVDIAVDFVRSDDCGAPSYLKSYGSWREGDKRRRKLLWGTSNAVNLRSPVSYRCIGVNHCSFILDKDYPPAVSWSTGVVFIKYACFDDTASLHYCNREVRISEHGPDSEGYVRTPGYPDFYVGEESCRWRLRTHPEQRLQITLLDVSLRSIGPFEDHCTDSISVVDSNGVELVSSCEQVELPLRLTSTTSIVDIIVEAKSHGAFPKRGVLLHYKSIGCVTHPAPSNGYLVYRSEDFAHYMCNVNLVFIDTRQRSRVMWCYDDNRWNDTVPLPLCVDSSAIDHADHSNITLEQQLLIPRTATTLAPKTTKGVPFEGSMLVDIVIPSLLITALFIGNAFIVFVIYKYRKRKNDDLDDEFNTIPLSANGNVHSAGNAV